MGRFIYLVLALLALDVATRAFPSPGQSEPKDHGKGFEAAGLTATVRAVDAKAGTLDVITGVGLALRMMRIWVDPASQIKVKGAAAQLADLKPGDIVRIGYRKTADRNIAEMIETLPQDKTGSKR